MAPGTGNTSAPTRRPSWTWTGFNTGTRPAPYHPQGREPYQIYALADMDEVAAAAAIRELFHSGGLANLPCDDEAADMARRRA